MFINSIANNEEKESVAFDRFDAKRKCIEFQFGINGDNISFVRFVFSSDEFLENKQNSIVEQMVSIKVVLLTEPDANAPDLSTASKSHQQLLAKKIENVVNELTYKFETVEFSKLQFQEQESVDKFLSANIVIMVRRLDENFVKILFSSKKKTTSSTFFRT